MVDTDTIPVQQSTRTYQIMLRRPDGAKMVYTVTSPTLSYEGVTTEKDGKRHFSVFTFFEPTDGRRYLLIYNYRNKVLYKTDWFDDNATGDILIPGRVDFRNMRVSIRGGSQLESSYKVELTQVKL